MQRIFNQRNLFGITRLTKLSSHSSKPQGNLEAMSNDSGSETYDQKAPLGYAAQN